MPVRTITESNVAEILEGHDKVILDFWAPWCAPCQAFAPVFEQASEDFPDYVFGRINTEKESGLKKAFEIKSIPTLMVFRDQILLGVQPGLLPPEVLRALIEKANAVDMDEVRREFGAVEMDDSD